MTTINGVTFNMKTLEPVGTHRNVPNEGIGTDESFITDMGYTGLIMRMTGYEKTLAKYDEVINEFIKPGAHTLVYRTGWQFTVYSTQYVPMLDVGIVDNFFPYELTMLTSNPYRESTTETTRTKTITTNNQEWDEDDFNWDIDTDGSVDAVPDIQVTGGAVGATFGREGGFLNTETDATEFGTNSESWVLQETYTYTANANRGWILDTVGCKVKSTGGVSTGYAKFTYTAASLNAGAETDVPGGSFSQYGSSWSALQSVTDLNIVCAGNEDLVVKLYCTSSSSAQTGSSKDQNIKRGTTRKYTCTSPVIYNTADTTVKSEVANEIELDTIVRINTDGTGTVVYADDFTTDKYLDAAFIHEDETYDDPNNELDFADNGYLTYKTDVKYPITGIPTLTAYINIISGTPTIQISSDGSTWYNITTTIVDLLTTIYELDCSSLSLKGRTEFYWRLDCTDTGTHTCSLREFTLDIVFTTLDIEHPKIGATGVSTFRCDQDTDSGLNCAVSLVYRDKSWAA